MVKPGLPSLAIAATGGEPVATTTEQWAIE